MTLTTPAAIAALPNAIVPGITTGLEAHLEAVYAYLKDLAGLVNTEMATASIRLGAASPPGSVTAFAGAAAPDGWLLCNGATISRTTYAELFSAIGTAHGVGDGTTTFRLPDLQGRTVVARDTTQTEFDLLGETGGAKTHTLTTAETPVHTHGVNLITSSDNHTHNFPGKGSASATVHSHNQTDTAATGQGSTSTNGTVTTSNHSHSHTAAGNTTSVGGGSAHNNLQPYIVLNYIIKT